MAFITSKLLAKLVAACAISEIATAHHDLQRNDLNQQNVRSAQGVQGVDGLKLSLRGLKDAETEHLSITDLDGLRRFFDSNKDTLKIRGTAVDVHRGDTIIRRKKEDAVWYELKKAAGGVRPLPITVGAGVDVKGRENLYLVLENYLTPYSAPSVQQSKLPTGYDGTTPRTIKEGKKVFDVNNDTLPSTDRKGAPRKFVLHEDIPGGNIRVASGITNMLSFIVAPSEIVKFMPNP